jgi:hypothetical protein
MNLILLTEKIQKIDEILSQIHPPQANESVTKNYLFTLENILLTIFHSPLILSIFI